MGLPNWVVTPIGSLWIARAREKTPIGEPQLGRLESVLRSWKNSRVCAVYVFIRPNWGAPIGLPSSHFLQMLSQVLAIAIIWTCQQKHLRFFGSGKRNKWREHTVHCCLLRIGFWECCLTVWQRTFVRRIQYSWNSPTAFLSVGQYLVQPVFLFFYHGTQLELPHLSFD